VRQGCHGAAREQSDTSLQEKHNETGHSHGMNVVEDDAHLKVDAGALAVPYGVEEVPGIACRAQK